MITYQKQIANDCFQAKISIFVETAQKDLFVIDSVFLIFFELKIFSNFKALGTYDIKMEITCHVFMF